MSVFTEAEKAPQSNATGKDSLWVEVRWFDSLVDPDLQVSSSFWA